MNNELILLLQMDESLVWKLEGLEFGKWDSGTIIFNNYLFQTFKLFKITMEII